MSRYLSAEQLELQSVVRSFLEDKAPEEEVRRVMATDAGYDADVWAQMAQQLGLQGLAVPEEFGGSGFSFTELCLVLEELGRCLLPAPFLSTAVLAAYTLLFAGDLESRALHLPGIAAGETVATLALAESHRAWDPAAMLTAATPGDAGWRLDGSKTFVLDGHLANLLLVVARTPGGIGVFAVDGSAPGVVRRRMATMDQTRRLAEVTFVDAPAEPVAVDAGVEDRLRRVLDLASVALAAEQVGGAQKCLDMSVDYAKLRRQFGKPIGSFQAIKHKCADMFVSVESARSAVYYALFAHEDESPEFPVLASLVQAHCSEAYTAVAAENIQIHGGIGFTWEHPAHLYFKRAKTSELLFGDAAHHREALVQRLAV